MSAMDDFKKQDWALEDVKFINESETNENNRNGIRDVDEICRKHAEAIRLSHDKVVELFGGQEAYNRIRKWIKGE